MMTLKVILNDLALNMSMANFKDLGHHNIYLNLILDISMIITQLWGVLSSWAPLAHTCETAVSKSTCAIYRHCCISGEPSIVLIILNFSLFFDPAADSRDEFVSE